MEELVSIVILNWNGLKDTIECLESLREVDYPNYEIIVVDNGSTDGSCEFLKKNFPHVRLIENGTNLGVPQANNIGIREAKGEYVLLLNNDVVVDPGFLKELVAIAGSDSAIGAVGSAVYCYDNPAQIWYGWGKISWGKGIVQAIKPTEVDLALNKEPVQVDFIPSCSLLMRRELFNKVGYMDPKYFAYYDETDWCVRAQRAGYKLLYVPKAKVWHKGSATSKKIRGFTQYYLTRNRFLFMKKLATRRQLFSFLLWFFLVDFWVRSGVLLIYHRNLKALSSFYKGINDGLFN